MGDLQIVWGAGYDLDRVAKVLDQRHVVGARESIGRSPGQCLLQQPGADDLRRLREEHARAVQCRDDLAVPYTLQRVRCRDRQQGCAACRCRLDAGPCAGDGEQRPCRIVHQHEVTVRTGGSEAALHRLLAVGTAILDAQCAERLQRWQHRRQMRLPVPRVDDDDEHAVATAQIDHLGEPSRAAQQQRFAVERQIGLRHGTAEAGASPRGEQQHGDLHRARPYSDRVAVVRILGIDPGTQVVGFGCLEVDVGGAGRPMVGAAPLALRVANAVRGGAASVRLVELGVLRLGGRDAELPARLLALADQFRALVARLLPNELALEEAFYGKSVPAALRIGEARGVVLAESARAGIDVFQFAPARIKRCVTGSGAASKEAVAAMLPHQLVTGGRLPALPVDATDALAAALTRVEQRRSPLLAASADAKPGRPRRRARAAPQD